MFTSMKALCEDFSGPFCLWRIEHPVVSAPRFLHSPNTRKSIRAGKLDVSSFISSQETFRHQHVNSLVSFPVSWRPSQSPDLKLDENPFQGLIIDVYINFLSNLVELELLWPILLCRIAFIQSGLEDVWPWKVTPDLSCVKVMCQVWISIQTLTRPTPCALYPYYDTDPIWDWI